MVRWHTKKSKINYLNRKQKILHSQWLERRNWGEIGSEAHQLRGSPLSCSIPLETLHKNEYTCAFWRMVTMHHEATSLQTQFPSCICSIIRFPIWLLLCLPSHLHTCFLLFDLKTLPHFLFIWAVFHENPNKRNSIKCMWTAQNSLGVISHIFISIHKSCYRDCCRKPTPIGITFLGFSHLVTGRCTARISMEMTAPSTSLSWVFIIISTRPHWQTVFSDIHRVTLWRGFPSKVLENIPKLKLEWNVWSTSSFMNCRFELASLKHMHMD